MARDATCGEGRSPYGSFGRRRRRVLKLERAGWWILFVYWMFWNRSIPFS